MLLINKDARVLSSYKTIIKPHHGYDCESDITLLCVYLDSCYCVFTCYVVFFITNTRDIQLFVSIDFFFNLTQPRFLLLSFLHLTQTTVVILTAAGK